MPDAGVGMFRELSDLTGLSARITAVLADIYRGPWIHAPGDVFADLAAAVADGAVGGGIVDGDLAAKRAPDLVDRKFSVDANAVMIGTSVVVSAVDDLPVADTGLMSQAQLPRNAVV